MTVEELKVLITAEMSGVKKEVNKVRKQMDILNKTVDTSAKHVDKSTKRISASFSAMGKTIKRIVSVAALLSLGKQAIELASDLEEVQNVVDTAFGSMANEANKFAQNALESFGITETMAKRMSSTFMVMSNSLGVAKKQGKEMAFTLTGLAGDMSSFYNVSQDIAETALKSIFTGETEALKKFGIVMTDVNLEAFAAGMGKVYKNMSQAEKVTLRYQYVLKNTGQAQGDFAKTSKSWANQIRILKGQIQELLSIIGSGLKNVLTPVVSKLNDLLAVAIKVGNIFAEVFGWDNSSTGSQIEDIKEDLENTTEEVNALKKATMGFDELNILGGEKKTTDNSGGNSGDDNGSDIVTKEEEPGWAKKLKSTLEAIKKIASEIGNIFSDGDLTFTEKFKQSWETIKTELDLPTHFANIKDNIDKATASLGGFDNVLKAVKGTALSLLAIVGAMNIVPIIGGLLTSLITGWFKPLTEAAFAAGAAVDSVQFTLRGARLIFEDPQAAMGFISWSSILKNGIAEIGAKFTAFGSSVMGIFKSIGAAISGISAPVAIAVAAVVALIATIADTFDAFKENILAPMGEKIAEVFNKIKTAVAENILPAFDKLKESLSKIWKDLLLPFWEYLEPILVYIIGFLSGTLLAAFDIVMNVLGVVGEYFTEIFGGIISIISEIIDFLVNVFTVQWDAAWVNIAGIFEEIWNGLVDTIKGIVNLIIGVINGMVSGVLKGVNYIISAINSIKVDIPDWLSELTGITKIGFNMELIDISKAQIPYLANGGVITSPTMAMMGEYAGAKTNPEIVAPESLLRNIFEESQTNVINAVYSMGNMISKAIKDKDMNTYLDGMELSRGLYNHTNLIQQQKGLSLIK